MKMPDSSQCASGGTSGRSGSESMLDTDVLTLLTKVKVVAIMQLIIGQYLLLIVLLRYWKKIYSNTFTTTC
jgi:hypothetical protein